MVFIRFTRGSPDDYEEILKKLEARYGCDRNPLDAIDAIGTWLRAVQYGVDPRPPLPDWLYPYLSTLTFNMDLLGQGLDFRDIPSPGEDPSDIEEWFSKPTIKTAEAARRLVPQALGLTRPGWSAFSQAASRRKDANIHRYIAELRDRGFRGSANEHAADKFGTDLRNIRRRSSRARNRE